MFGDYIRQRRVEQGMTLSTLAEKTGVSASYLSRIERGERSVPGLLLIQKVADALQIDPAFLSNIAGLPGSHLRELSHPYGMSATEWLEANALLPRDDWEDVVALIRQKMLRQRRSR